jgi:hypothetical protein
MNVVAIEEVLRILRNKNNDLWNLKAKGLIKLIAGKKRLDRLSHQIIADILMIASGSDQKHRKILEKDQNSYFGL